MRLTDLEAKFFRFERRPTEVQLVDGDSETWEERGKPVRTETLLRDHYILVETLSEADMIEFLCPLCFQKNGGPVGTHVVICHFTGRVPDDAKPGPGRWNPAGTGLDDLTFVGPGLTSVQLIGGCGWHGHVNNGDAA